MGPLVRDDAEAIARIYTQGIEERIATFETELRSTEDMLAYLSEREGKYPVIVAELNGEVVGWGSLSKFRPRAAYAPTVEASAYIRHDMRRQGLGRLILESITTRDYPIVQAGVLVLSALYLTGNLFVDVLYSYLNPRIRHAA